MRTTTLDTSMRIELSSWKCGLKAAHTTALDSREIVA